MAIYRFKISFEDYDDVVREIDVKTTQTFEDLHRAIHRSTGYNADKSSSFFVSTDNWIKGEEISLLPNERKVKNGVKLMENSKLSSFVEDPHQKFYYIYNFERPFDFHVELVKIILENDPNIEYPFLVKSTGDAPKIIEKNAGGFAVSSAAASSDFDFLNEMDFVPEDTDELEAMDGRGIMATETDEESEEEEQDDFSNEEEYGQEDEYGSEKDDY